MVTTILAHGDTIKIEKSIVTGKDRVAINGQAVFDGRLPQGALQEFTVGGRKYALSMAILSGWPQKVGYQIQVTENGAVVHAGLYNQAGQPVSDAARLKTKTNGPVQVCTVIRGIGGFITMMALNQATGGAVPGGAIGGAIGGGGGALLGQGLGRLLFAGKNG
jgi:hypothetical protein